MPTNLDSTVDRRTFLGAAAVGAASALATPAVSRAASGNGDIRIGLIGCGNQGLTHIAQSASLKGAKITRVADVDRARREKAAAQVGGQATGDFRQLLDDPQIDAVIVVVPDHWHAPAAIMALEAGKHVYVEKPCTHNYREGTLLVAAADKAGKTVCHGTQSRSNPAIQQAIKLLHDGVIGDVLVAKCWNIQLRENIGKKQPSQPPEGVDYDTWVGPAEWRPFQENRFHYNWHWWYNFGCGDLGNDGIHEFDYALWGLGAPGLPARVSAAGGKYFFDDDQEFPDTQQVTFEFGDAVGERRMLIYEQRIWSTSYPFNVDSGVEYFGTKGRMFISKRGKFELRDAANKLLDIKLVGSPASTVVQNQQNWIDCIRSGDRPNAAIDIAHRTASAIHFGNVATRLGRTLQFDAASEAFTGDEEATAMLGRVYRKEGHWGIPSSIG